MQALDRHSNQAQWWTTTKPKKPKKARLSLRQAAFATCRLSTDLSTRLGGGQEQNHFLLFISWAQLEDWTCARWPVRCTRGHFRWRILGIRARWRIVESQLNQTRRGIRDQQTSLSLRTFRIYHHRRPSQPPSIINQKTALFGKGPLSVTRHDNKNSRSPHWQQHRNIHQWLYFR